MMLHKKRRTVAIVLALLVFVGGIFYESRQPQDQPFSSGDTSQQYPQTQKAVDALGELEVKGRAPKTGYMRSMFGEGWADLRGCDVRNLVLQRDLQDIVVADDNCKVTSGVFLDPYTGKMLEFKRGQGTSSDVQIDHIVALSDAWQKGAQQLSQAEREQLANDSLDLLAVDGATNMKKSDGDAATWLPPNKPYRCQFVARQIAVKKKYKLWVTPAERDAMKRILSSCPDQLLPAEDLGAN